MLGFWLLLGLLDLLKNFVAAYNAGRIFAWDTTLKFVLIYSLAWCLLSWPIYRLFQTTKKWSWPARLASQLPLSLVFAALHILIVSLSFSYLTYLNAEQTPGFTEFYLTRISSRFLPAWLNSTFAYWVMLIILFAFNYYEQYRQQSLHALRLASQLSQAELQALRMQVQPHFLFNAHNTIAMLIRRGQYEQATNMLSGMSDLLRATLTQKHTQLVPVQEEIDLMRQYLEIEQLRFEDTLQIKVAVDPRATQALAPNLILQPLVENAFKHGIAKCMGETQLDISVARVNGMLRLSVYNSGPSLPEAWTKEQDVGIGLSNVLGRLQQMFPEEHTFSMRNYDHGVRVDIDIPYQTEAGTHE